jgi:hypothetical protein
MYILKHCVFKQEKIVEKLERKYLYIIYYILLNMNYLLYIIKHELFIIYY